MIIQACPIWACNGEYLVDRFGSVDQALLKRALRNTWRELRVVRIVDESQSIRSFYFESTDGAALPLFEAGQHLPVRFSLNGQTSPTIRTYSLSSAPSDLFLRISVKRDGSVSSHLHDNIKVGDIVQARAPQGHFIVDAKERRPLVLLAAGVGVTPLLSMLREVIYQGKRIARMRPTWIVQSARSVADLAFGEEITELANQGGEKVRALRLISQPEANAREGEGFELAGRIDLELLKTLLPLNDYDFYLCGRVGSLALAPCSNWQKVVDWRRNSVVEVAPAAPVKLA